MHIFNLEARNNGDFLFIRTVNHFATLYDLANAVLRAQLRRPGAGQDVAFEFSTANTRIDYLPVSKQIVMSARAGDIGHLSGTYNYDLRVEIGEAIRQPIYGGTIVFIEGATK